MYIVERLLPVKVQCCLEHSPGVEDTMIVMIATKQNLMNQELGQNLLFNGNNAFQESEIWDVHFALCMELTLYFVYSSTRDIYIICLEKQPH
jgi:hypothetical protein